MSEYEFNELSRSDSDAPTDGHDALASLGYRYVGSGFMLTGTAIAVIETTPPTQSIALIVAGAALRGAGLFLDKHLG